MYIHLRCQALLKLLGDIDQQLLRGGILRGCLTQIRGSSARMIEALKASLRSDLTQLEAKLVENTMQVCSKASLRHQEHGSVNRSQTGK